MEEGEVEITVDGIEGWAEGVGYEKFLNPDFPDKSVQYITNLIV